ncbi:MAG TPA: ribokinase [Acidobacteriaceae bacterium]|nr:ribokinase [Acidobacteriaceae bacterium]
MPSSIVVVGSINLDLVCSGKRIPAPGETLKGDKFQTFHGGKGANQAVAVARLGYGVNMIGKVGDDDFGKRLRQGLRDAGVGVKGVGTAKGVSSGVALITVAAGGQNSITVIPGANDQLRPADLEACLPQLRSAGMILTQLEIPMDTVECLGAIARRFDIPFMLDPAPVPARPIPRKILRHVTYLTPNETETAALCGIAPGELTPANVATFAQLLLNTGPANVIVKMGSQGAYIAGADGLRRMVPAFKVKAVDSTAAGDAFNAGLAVGLVRGMSLLEAVRYGSATGALSATRAGAQTSMPEGREVTRMLEAADSRRPARSRETNGKRHTPKELEPLETPNVLQLQN